MTRIAFPRHRNSRQRQNCGRNISRPGKSRRQLLLTGNRLSGDNQRYPHTPFPRIKLVVRQGTRRGAGEAGTECAEAALQAEVVVIYSITKILRRQSLGKGLGVIGATGLAAIVRGENENGVVVLTLLFEERHQATNIKIHRLNHGSVNRHALSLIAPAFFIQITPFVCRCHAQHGGVLWHNAQRDCSFHALLTQCVPAGIVHAHVAFDVFPRSLHRRVHGHERQIGEKRFPVL